MNSTSDPDPAVHERGRRLGAFAGLIHVAPHFDETSDEILQSLEEPLVWAATRRPAR